MTTYIFVRFHAIAGRERDLERALSKVGPPTREEPGCVAYHAFRSIRDDGIFYVHSVWHDETAFDLHAELPHTVAFIDEVAGLIDHPVQAVRTELLE